MTVEPGARLGSYHVVSGIGRGAMGEVFRAVDTKLGRDVAIKVLPPAFALDTERVGRFRREAQVLASLNHPHIAQIHGLEDVDGVQFLVMELVDGQSLDARIARGPVPIDEAVPIAKQIAEALETAHEKGIVHRDLKPANIALTHDGQVKVLDFGLAKALDPSGAHEPTTSPARMSVLANSPTIMSPATLSAVGVILGTAAYMSPEQAKGKFVDRRADIWAFGAVVYEMLTGMRAFGGTDVEDAFVAILRDDPDWSRLPAALPMPLIAYLKRCLHKDPKQRVQSIGDMRLALEGAFDTATPAAAAIRSLPARVLPLATAAALAAGLGIGLWAPWRSQATTDRRSLRLDVDLGNDAALPASANGTPNIAISPDGTQLAYTSGTPPKLYVRRLDQLNAAVLPGTEGAGGLFFSPDGQWIGFIRGGSGTTLNKVAAAGGPVVPLATIANFTGAVWGDDGNILVADGFKGLVRVPSSGGEIQQVAELAPGEVAVASPAILPGGKAVAMTGYASLTNSGSGWIEVLTLADRHRKLVVRSGTSPRYVPTSATSGHLLYLDKTAMFALPFDPNALEARGPAAPVLDDVGSVRTLQIGDLDVSRTGALVYRRTGAETESLHVAWLDAAGHVQPVSVKPGVYGRPSPSPDGHRVAVEVSEASGTDIWVADSDRGTMTRITFTGTAMAPVWTPDARYIVYEAGADGMSAIRSDGSGQPQRLTTSGGQYPWSFSADGQRLAFGTISPKTLGDLWTVQVESGTAGLRLGQPQPFLQTPAFEQAPAFSPDGRWLAYASDESGTYQVYVRAFPDNGSKWQISSGGGEYPLWSWTEHQILFESLDQHIVAVPYTISGNSFVPGRPRPWTDKAIGGLFWFKNVDIAADGKRVLALMPAAPATGSQQSPRQVAFVLNFFDELRRRAPARN